MIWKKHEKIVNVAGGPLSPLIEQQLQRQMNANMMGGALWHVHGRNFFGTTADGTNYTLWSKDVTYFETCRQHYIGNLNGGNHWQSM
eukprot:scaffold14574_cov38-Cyclotella_meneghiniana.AAC.5